MVDPGNDNRGAQLQTSSPLLNTVGPVLIVIIANASIFLTSQKFETQY